MYVEGHQYHGERFYREAEIHEGINNIRKHSNYIPILKIDKGKTHTVNNDNSKFTKKLGGKTQVMGMLQLQAYPINTVMYFKR